MSVGSVCRCNAKVGIVYSRPSNIGQPQFWSLLRFLLLFSLVVTGGIDPAIPFCKSKQASVIARSLLLVFVFLVSVGWVHKLFRPPKCTTRMVGGAWVVTTTSSFVVVW